ncbi:E3 ubiquitin-protein ligase ARI5 [Phlyctema vagabunda]|uniref:RBR-type E3 ubiquitin transferase n=1 Tax=Phlyctema vagabunda TaxID=108571 RepID=A0ABR4PP71_9HELO
MASGTQGLFGDIDDASAALILQLRLDDARELQEGSSTQPSADLVFAAEVQREELQRSFEILQDWDIAQQLAGRPSQLNNRAIAAVPPAAGNADQVVQPGAIRSTAQLEGPPNAEVPVTSSTAVPHSQQQNAAAGVRNAALLADGNDSSTLDSIETSASTGRDWAEFFRGLGQAASQSTPDRLASSSPSSVSSTRSFETLSSSSESGDDTVTDRVNGPSSPEQEIDEIRATIELNNALGVPGATGELNVVARSTQLFPARAEPFKGRRSFGLFGQARAPIVPDKKPANTSGQPVVVLRECIACNSSFHLRGACLTCKHDYCGECLKKLFSDSLTDQSLYPPRCCKIPIPVRSVSEHLTPELLAQHLKKKVEFDQTDKTYCSIRTCSTFLRPQDIEIDVGVCPECKVQTCVKCKNTLEDGKHEGRCELSKDLQEMKDLMKINGWQQCPKCQHAVSISTGCNHMICTVCKDAWCYLCRAPWKLEKTCECPSVTEKYLIIRAEEMVRDQGVGEGEPRGYIFDRAMGVARRQCVEHGDWEFSRGAGTCAMCSADMPVFTFICARCPYHVCRRCRDNRA